MSEKNKDWNKPEEKFPENETEETVIETAVEKEEEAVPETVEEEKSEAVTEGTEEAETEEKSEEPSKTEKETPSSEEKPEKKEKEWFGRAKRIIDKKRPHKFAATLGAVLTGLAVVGAIAVIGMFIRLTGRIIDNSKQKEKLEWKLYPVLMLDPATFDDPSQLDEVFLLKTALWSTLLENRTSYTYDDTGMLQVPASDLDVASKKLYGDCVTLEHQSFSEGYEYFYLYDEETGIYSVPVSGQTAGYYPKVVRINRAGDIYTLIVGYVSPTTLWNMSEDGKKVEDIPDKYMYYDLERVSGGDFIIKAVRSIPADELPDDLEVASQQSLNQTQYFDYDEMYQQYLQGELIDTAENVDDSSEEAEKTKEEAEETPSDK